MPLLRWNTPPTNSNSRPGSPWRVSVAYEGHSVTRADADALGSWWEDRRGLIQPSNFVLNGDGKVLSATYSSGPIGRLEAVDAVRFIQFQEKLKQQSA